MLINSTQSNFTPEPAIITIPKGGYVYVYQNDNESPYVVYVSIAGTYKVDGYITNNNRFKEYVRIYDIPQQHPTLKLEYYGWGVPYDYVYNIEILQS